jgi:hypothetical protein
VGNRIFPTDLAGSGWVEFPAEGFSQQATGVIYRDGSNERGVPLGGLGTTPNPKMGNTVLYQSLRVTP